MHSLYPPLIGRVLVAVSNPVKKVVIFLFAINLVAVKDMSVSFPRNFACSVTFCKLI